MCFTTRKMLHYSPSTSHYSFDFDFSSSAASLSSFERFAAASTAFITHPLNPTLSKACIPAIVVPPGDATLSLSNPGCSPVSSTIFAAPKTVCAAKFKATDLGRPMRTPPSAIASIIMYTYAGPLPLRPVTASKRFSLTLKVFPHALRMFSTSLPSSTEAHLPKAYAEAVAPTRHGVFGITRTIRVPTGRYLSMLLIETPAAMDITNVSFPM
mmetsp:Transcript_13593/g.21726  ORF Transcript_13593/g.21726 Transcript_13593/m.21726 type:complete len:212 (+) Transcript_13593:179-814(+)